MTRSFRFGLLMTRGVASGREWTELCRQAEDLGYSTMLVTDHLPGPEIAPMTALGWAAASTTSLRVGPLVLNNEIRHPVLVAREAAALDLLSDGRLELGLGAGWWPIDFTALGMEMARPGIRLERFAEAVGIIRRLLHREKVDHTGTHYRVDDFSLVPPARQEPAPPIFIGGGGDRVLRLAGEMADIVGINPSLGSGELGVAAYATATDELLSRKIEVVRRAAAHRAVAPELQITVYHVGIGAQESSAREAFALASGFDAKDVETCPHALFGSVESVADRLRRRRAEHGITYVVVPVDAAVQFAPVVARLVGEENA